MLFYSPIGSALRQGQAKASTYGPDHGPIRVGPGRSQSQQGQALPLDSVGLCHHQEKPDLLI